MMVSLMLVVRVTPTVPIRDLVPPAVTVKLVLNSKRVMMVSLMLVVRVTPTAPMPVPVPPVVMVRPVLN